tara:strand:+ start:1863 stop:2789 length:927 start_codon:yes stop_codon:yes gene_type:complete
MHKITGTFPAVLTPVNENFSINKNLFLNHCQNLLKEGVDGLAVFGTTGEANSFTVEEKIEVMQFLSNNIKSEFLIPGSGQCSIKDTVRLTKEFAKLKTKAILILPPFFYKNISDDGLINFYRNVIENVAESDLKYILYHIPQVSGVSFSFKIIENLIKLYPENIIGMKDSSGDIDNMLKIIKYFDKFSLFSGSDSLALKVRKHGGAGAITATSNICAKLLSFIVKNYKNDQQIQEFKFLQDLLVQIRLTTFREEPISTLKGFLSLINNNENWNNIVPPLKKIISPEKNKNILQLIDLVKKIDKNLPNA